MSTFRWRFALAVAALLLASATVGAGTVSNVPTWFQSFTASATTAVNDGSSTIVFSVTMLDNNSESSITSVRVFVNGTAALTSTRTVVATDLAATTEPAAFGSDGWKVWSGTANDGTLYAKRQQTIPSGQAVGTYTFGVRTHDTAGKDNYPPPSMQIPVVVHAPSVISVASAPVSATGVAQTGIAWGAWSANPGDANVAGTNYLKLTNTGAYATPTVVVDFTEATFTGASDASWTVPLDANVQFAWWEDTTPASTAPNQGTYAFGSTSASGSVTVTFTASSNIVYVAYRIVAMPTVLPVQSYTATYTVTDITI